MTGQTLGLENGVGKRADRAGAGTRGVNAGDPDPAAWSCDEGKADKVTTFLLNLEGDTTVAGVAASTVAGNNAWCAAAMVQCTRKRRFFSYRNNLNYF